jgi:site-specific DNA recombinase
MKRCGLYVRVSTDNQLRGPEGSLKSQMQRLREELAAKSTAEDPWVETRQYVEEGYSGKNINRPKFKELLRDIRDGVIDMVLCTELSRISRSLRDFLEIIDYFKKFDIQMIVLRQNIDTTTPIGKVIFTILVTLSEFERDLTADRTSENMLARARRGLWNGGQVLGYNINPHKKGYLIISNEEAKVVEDAFSMYIKLGSCSAVAKYLNEKGYRTKEYTSVNGKHHPGRKFTKQYMHHILTNKTYVGEKEVNKYCKHADQKALIENKRYSIVKACWDGIIKKEVFERVQKSLKRKFKRSIHQVNNYPFLLSGIAKCGICGSPFEGATAKKPNGKQYYYYRHSQKNKACKIKPVSAYVLDIFVKERINSLITTNSGILEDIVETANQKLHNLAPELSKLVKQKHKELNSVKIKIDSLLTHNTGLSEQQMREIVSPRIDEQHRRHVEIGNEINRLKSELDNLKNNYINPKEFKENASVVLRALQKLSPIKQKEVISALIDKIMVYPGKLKLFFFRMKSRLRLVDALPGEDWFEERLQCGAIILPLFYA